MASGSENKYEDIKYDGWKQVENEVTFLDAAGSGSIGTVSLFTVTGSVKVKLVGICSTNMAGASATIEVGVTGNTPGLIAQTTATNLIASEIWHDATPDNEIELSSIMIENIIANGLDIFTTVGTAALTAGVIKFIVLWKPLSRDGNVESA